MNIRDNYMNFVLPECNYVEMYEKKTKQNFIFIALSKLYNHKIFLPLKHLKSFLFSKLHEIKLYTIFTYYEYDVI